MRAAPASTDKAMTAARLRRDIDLNDLLAHGLIFTVALANANCSTSELNDELPELTLLRPASMGDDSSARSQYTRAEMGRSDIERNRRLLFPPSDWPRLSPRTKRLPALSEHRVHDSGMLGEYRWHLDRLSERRWLIEHHLMIKSWAP